MVLFVSACDDDQEALTDDDMDELAAFELGVSALPASPTNRYADDVAAAALGRTLFFDPGLSSDGNVACVDCHAPEDDFGDARRVSEGIEERRGAADHQRAFFPFSCGTGAPTSCGASHCSHSKTTRK